MKIELPGRSKRGRPEIHGRWGGGGGPPTDNMAYVLYNGREDKARGEMTVQTPKESRQEIAECVPKPHSEDKCKKEKF